MPQDPNKVKLVDASPETREKLKIYLGTLRIRKCTIGNKDIKTLEDAILFSMQEAEKVPVLEKENQELVSTLKKREEFYHKMVDDFADSLEVKNKRIEELEGENEKLKGGN